MKKPLEIISQIGSVYDTFTPIDHHTLQATVSANIGRRCEAYDVDIEITTNRNNFTRHIVTVDRTRNPKFFKNYIVSQRHQFGFEPLNRLIILGAYDIVVPPLYFSFVFIARILFNLPKVRKGYAIILCDTGDHSSVAFGRARKYQIVETEEDYMYAMLRSDGLIVTREEAYSFP